MKNLMNAVAIAIFTLATATGTLAQRGNGYENPQRPGTYSPRDHDNGRYGNGNDGYRRYDRQDAFRPDHPFWQTNWRDQLNLSRRQRRDLDRIDADYAKVTPNPRDPRNRAEFRDLQRRKYVDVMAVLNSVQRDFVFGQLARRSPGGYPNNPGNGPQYGRRW